MNVENFKRVLKQIEDHPETWNQATWHCGTTHCFAGWAEVFAKSDRADFYRGLGPRSIARLFLDADIHEADYLFDRDRSLPEIRSFLLLSVQGDQNGYDHEGFNRYGCDHEGFNRYGYDRDGYGRDGYGRDGYDRDGYGRDGYDRDGYGRDGYDHEGFNPYGYDRDGYDQDGYDRDGLDVNNKLRGAK